MGFEPTTPTLAKLGMGFATLSATIQFPYKALKYLDIIFLPTLEYLLHIRLFSFTVMTRC